MVKTTILNLFGSNSEIIANNHLKHNFVTLACDAGFFKGNSAIRQLKDLFKDSSHRVVLGVFYFSCVSHVWAMVDDHLHGHP